MNKEYKIKLDLNKKLYNKKMAFNQFDENVNDFYIEVTKNNKVVKDLDKSIITLVAIKPNGEVDAQFIEVKEGQIYADLKPSMCDLVGNYQAKAMIVLEGKIVTTDTINYSVTEDKIISKLNDDVVSDERFTLFTDALARLSAIEISEEQRVKNEAERILSEENRKIEEAKRVEAELIRQHEEADRAKYDAIRESNENIRKQNESIRLANETNRIDEEAKRVEEENKRKLAEEERNANYNFMTEDEERRRSEANAHKEAEVLRVQAETNRVNEEAKRRTTEQARVSAENIRVSNENTRETNEVARQNNENQRIEAETQRKNRYNSFISDAEANANNFENYTNTAKAKEEERKANELDRKSQEDRRVSNEVERISNENTRKANEIVREENEASRQNTFTNKVNEVDKKIVELNTTKDNFVSSVNTKVDNKISELDSAKSDMTNTVSNKIDEVENRFNALTSSQQQDAEVIDARDGETSLKARLDRDIEKAKQVYVNVEGSNISTDSSVGYAKDVEIFGNTIQDASNLADIRSVGDKVEGQELYEIPVLSRGKNLNSGLEVGTISNYGVLENNDLHMRSKEFIQLYSNNLSISTYGNGYIVILQYDKDKKFIELFNVGTGNRSNITLNQNAKYIKFRYESTDSPNIQIEYGSKISSFEPYQEDKLTILSPVQLEKVGDVADRIIEKDGVWGVEKNVITRVLDGSGNWIQESPNVIMYGAKILLSPLAIIIQSNEIKHLSYPLASKKHNQWNSSELEGTHIHPDSNYVFVNVLSSKLESHDLTSFKKWLQANPNTVKYATTQPQFIPLPHDQQVKLRTFANKTNISFLTEIEGTIKAQVPKSLGATVNTHTEQINNLNKELDRVKKLEESTVSTVETESDFTTVEATSNGYFEDVKLEGKTLVNRFAFKNLTLSHNNDELRVTFKEYVYSGTYTVVNTFGKDIMLEVYDKNSGNFSRNITIHSNSSALVTILENERFDIIKGRTANGWDVNSETDKEVMKKQLILEGDHTQNPPSYFEGLKSVGDGADEIVVSSVNENLFDSNKLSNGEITNLNEKSVYKFIDNASNFTFNGKFKKNTQYTISLTMYRDSGFESKSLTIRFLYTDGTEKRYNLTPGIEYTFTSDEGKTIERILGSHNYALNVYIDLEATKLEEGTVATQYTPHQSDKKRLLYYNNETQAWEKPILREWDSIEKHADGKYYYHQRSGEIVLNGSENWVVRDTRSNTSSFKLGNISNIASININDKFIVNNNVNADEESLNTLSSYNEIVVSIYNSKLSIQDAQGFKQWLQANNVTVVYQLAQEKVYECTNIDLITYANETNYIVECGVIAPKSILKVHNNISNVVSLLQKKVSLLESNITSYMITQNRLMLASRYNADTVSFKVDVASLRNVFEYDNDLYELILNNILVGKDNYNRDYIENLIIFYWMDFVISDEMYLTLFEIIEEQHNPKVIEEETPLI